MMGLLIAVVIVTIVIGWFVVQAINQQMRRHEQVNEELHDDHTPKLEYAVPNGQDPAMILAALERAGYTATVDTTHAHQVLLVACPGGVERERAHVRSLIESASVTTPEDGLPMDVDVRFRDED